VTATRHTIRIKREAPGCLRFEVLGSTGTLLARSTPYASICKLEAGLSVLTALARESETVVIRFDGNTTSVIPVGRRSRVILEGELHPAQRRVLFAGIPDAVVVDERPQKDRRSDLSGPLCALIA
jgi:hypothetical protein